MPDQVPKAVVQDRYERLIELQEAVAGDAARELVGREVEVLVNATDGRKDGATGRVSGRARDGRLVHVAAAGLAPVAPGDVVTATVTYAAPHHLVADADVRVGAAPDGRTRARHRGPCSRSAPAPPG